MVSELDIAVFLSATSVCLVVLEWTIIWFRGVRPIQQWLTGAGNSIVSQVLQRMGSLRTGRGKNPTAIETLAEASEDAPPPPENAPQRPLALPGIPTIAGIDPRALMEGKPLLDKFMAGKKLTPEETQKGMQLLGYFANVARQAPANGGGAGASSAGPTDSGWA